MSQQLFNQQWSVALLNAGSSLAQQQMQTQQTQRWNTFVQASTLAAAAYDAREQAADQERFAASRAAFSNRFWGALGLLGGVAEGVGAVGLAFAPDPTFLTKAGAAGLGVLAVDTLQSSWRQLWTGQATNTILHDASAATYQAAGLTAYEADQLATSTTGLAHLATGAASATRAAKGLEAWRVSAPRTAGPRLVHMTEASDAIRSSGRLGLPGDLYAGPASNAELSGWALTGRTGLSPSGNFEPILIPEAAEAAFRRPIPVGIGTAWQRFTGQQYAPRGVIDLGTGAFTRTGVNRSQALWYSIDAGFTGGFIGAGYLYATQGGDE